MICRKSKLKYIKSRKLYYWDFHIPACNICAFVGLFLVPQKKLLKTLGFATRNCVNFSFGFFRTGRIDCQPGNVQQLVYEVLFNVNRLNLIQWYCNYPFT